MSGITHDYMEEYIENLIPKACDEYKGLEDLTRENKVPIAQKEIVKFLEFVVSIKRPLRILELGTAIGHSTILMYEASGTKPIITTAECDENMIKYVGGNFEEYDLQKKIEIKEGGCLEILKNLSEPYNLIFMDARKGHYSHFLPHCLRLLKDDGVIVADNVLFRGMVASNELVKRRKTTIVKRMREYLKLVSNDKDLITFVIPMGDGIAVTKRRQKCD